MKNTLIAMMVSFEGFSLATEEKQTVTTITNAVRSAYLWNGMNYADRGVIQSDITFELPDKGISLNIWHSAGFDDDLSGGFDDEIDLTLTKSFQIGEKFSIDARVFYYDIVNLGKLEGLDTYGASMRFNLAITETISAFADIGHYIVFDGGDGGWVAEAGLSGEAPLGIEWGISMIQDDGPFGFSHGTVLKATLAKSWDLGKGWSLTAPEIAAYLPLRGTSDRDSICVFGAMLSKTF